MGHARDRRGVRRGARLARPRRGRTTANIRGGAQAALRRLSVAAIDLLYQFRIDPRALIAAVAGTGKDLVAEDTKALWPVRVRALARRRARAVHIPRRARQH